MKEDSKLATVRDAMQRGDWDAAILMVSRFQRLGPQGKAIRRGREAINNPEFYRQLGHDLQAIRAQAIAALKERYSRSWTALENPAKRKSPVKPRNRKGER
jgi:hypothetical protein